MGADLTNIRLLQISLARMSENQKLETAEELYSLFSDLERLKNYKYTQPVVSDCGIDNEKFHLDLPFDKIKAIVESCRDAFLATVPENERSSIKWEHVGSTSIKGMPGTMMPDALIVTPEFPPSKGLLKDHKLVVHIVTEDNVAAKILRDTRDLCNSEEWAFNDYKEAKMSAYKDSDGQFKNYKMGKGKQSKLLAMLREKYKFGSS